MGWHLLRLLVYRTKRYPTKGSDLESKIGQEFVTLGEHHTGLFPLYTNVNSSINEVIVTYIPCMHRNQFHEVLSRATAKYNLSLSTNSQFFQWVDNKYSLQVPMALFPSRNYVMLREIVETYILSTQLLGNYNISGVLINGVPGLGKSKSIHYLAKCNSARYLYRADLSSLELIKVPLDKSFVQSFSIW